MKFSLGTIPTSERPVALTTPTVTVCSRPNGLPIAMAHSPTSIRSESPSFAAIRPSSAGIWITARSVVASVPRSSRDLLLVVEPDRDLVRALDDVEVRQDVPLLVDDDARADARALPLARRHLAEVLVEVVLMLGGAPGGLPPRGRWRRRKCAVAMLTTARPEVVGDSHEGRWMSALVGPAARGGRGAVAGQRSPVSWSPRPTRGRRPGRPGRRPRP